MYDPKAGQVLGAATIAGGISMLADTAGTPVASFLGTAIKVSFILVAASFVITKIIKHAQKA